MIANTDRIIGALSIQPMQWTVKRLAEWLNMNSWTVKALHVERLVESNRVANDLREYGKGRPRIVYRLLK